MYRRRNPRRSDDGSRVRGVTAGGLMVSTAEDEEEWQQQQQQQQATSLIQLNRFRSNTLTNNCRIVFVRNPYYMFTDPTYCLTTISGIDRRCLEFHRQVNITDGG